jgi:uncharacterized protein YbjT (DUF2867 family)
MRVLLTGANGRTGRAVLRALVRRGAPVRAFLRRSEQWADLQRLGAHDVALGDLADPQSLAAAAAGCDRVIHIGPPMHPEEVELTANVLDAAKRAGLSRFVYYSVLQPLRREIRHHRLKLDAEEMLVGSGVAYTILQPSRYMQHLAPIWRDVVDRGVHAMPFGVDSAISVVDLEDLAEATAIVTLEDGHAHAIYELAGPQALSQRDMARMLSARLGRPVEAQAIPLADLEARARATGASEDRVGQMLIMNRHYDAHGMIGNPNVLRWLLGRDPTLFSEYVDRMAQAEAAR